MGLQEASGLGFVSGKGTRVQHSDKTPDSATGTQTPVVSQWTEQLWS